MVLFSMWAEDPTEESKTLWAVASSAYFTQLCFPLSLELHIVNPVGLPVLMKTEFWMKCRFLTCLSPKVEGECHTKRRIGTMQRQGLMILDYSDCCSHMSR